MGLIPDCGALHTLPRAVGLQRAKELVFSAREIDAQEALRLGLAMEVLPAEALLDRALALVAALREASPLALSLAKQGLNRSFDEDLAGLLDFEAGAQALALCSAPHADAVRRFASKAPARFVWPN